MCVHVCGKEKKTQASSLTALHLYPEAWSLPELTEPAGLGSQSVSFIVTVGGATAAPGLKCALGTVVLVLGISQ